MTHETRLLNNQVTGIRAIWEKSVPYSNLYSMEHEKYYCRGIAFLLVEINTLSIRIFTGSDLE